MPGRDGGRRKQKTQAWQKQAMHAVADHTELPGDLTTLTLICPYGRTAEESIYQLDQAIARMSIGYFLEQIALRPRAMFRVDVSAEYAERVQAIIANLQQW
jgi:hypothetical protein